VDGDIQKDVNTRFALQDAMAALVDSIPDDDTHVLDDARESVRTAVTDEVFQLRVVSAIPDFSGRLQIFKRLLALGFFFGDDSTSDSELDQRHHLATKVVHRLKVDSRYDTHSDHVDFVKVGALITLLDIGIAGGFGVPLQSVTVKTTEMRDAEEDFNRDMDSMSKRIFTLSSRIPESGASHMSRSDAKSALDRLHDRLTKSVRTKPKVKKSVFDSHEASEYESAGKTSIMSKFLQRTKDQGVEIVTVA